MWVSLVTQTYKISHACLGLLFIYKFTHLLVLTFIYETYLHFRIASRVKKAPILT